MKSSFNKRVIISKRRQNSWLWQRLSTDQGTALDMMKLYLSWEQTQEKAWAGGEAFQPGGRAHAKALGWEQFWNDWGAEVDYQFSGESLSIKVSKRVLRNEARDSGGGQIPYTLRLGKELNVILRQWEVIGGLCW